MRSKAMHLWFPTRHEYASKINMLEQLSSGALKNQMQTANLRVSDAIQVSGGRFQGN